MVELHNGDAIHKGFRAFVLPFLKHHRRQEMPVHHRPCVVDQSGMVARNQRPKRDLDQGEDQQAARHFGMGGSDTLLSRLEGRGGGDQQGKNHRGKGEVQHQAHRFHSRHARLETGCDHEPADKGLQSAQDTQAQQSQSAAATDMPAHIKPDIAKRKDHADKAAQLPVAPFPPVNAFEFGQLHLGIEQGILRNGFVFFEFRQPVLLIERRQRAEHRLPFGNRQSRSGHARGTAHDHHGKDKTRQQKQPQADQAQRARIVILRG